MRLKDKSFFRSKKGMLWNESLSNYRGELPLQVIDEKAANLSNQIANTLGKTFTFTCAGHFMSSQFIQVSMQWLWGALRIFQLQIWHCLIEVLFRAHLQIFYVISLFFSKADVFYGEEFYES